MGPPIARALALTLADPAAWLVAAVGFLARGGILLFLALIVQVPSPITVTLIFGMDAVTGTGQPSERLVATIAIAVALTLVAILLAIAVAAWADTVLFGRVRGEARARSGIVAELAWLQSLGILPGLVGFVLTAPLLRDLAVGELLLPSQLDVPFAVRVLREAQEPLVRALIVLAVFELLVTVATRVYLDDPGRRSATRAYLGAAAMIARRPIAVAAGWAVGWAVLIGAVALGLWAVALSWSEVRAAFLDASLRLPFLPGACLDPKACADPFSTWGPAVGALAATVLFTAVWIAAVLLVGLGSTFRSVLWTLSLGASREPDLVAEQLPTSQ